MKFTIWKAVVNDAGEAHTNASGLLWATDSEQQACEFAFRVASEQRKKILVKSDGRPFVLYEGITNTTKGERA